MSNPTDTPRLPRVATWDDIRPGAVVDTPKVKGATIAGRGCSVALFVGSGTHDYTLPRPMVERGYIALLAEAPALPADVASLAAWLDRKAAWSRETFGPPAPTDRLRIWKHMRRELTEIREDWDDMTEPADLILLAFDYMARHGMSGMDVVAMLVGKDRINQHERTWPDWRTADPTMPMEHVKGEGQADA